MLVQDLIYRWIALYFKPNLLPFPSPHSLFQRGPSGNSFLSLRANKGSAAISYEIASVVSLPRNDLGPQYQRGKGEYDGVR